MSDGEGFETSPERRSDSVKLNLEGDTLELTGPSNEEQRALIEAWVARHTHGLLSYYWLVLPPLEQLEIEQVLGEHGSSLKDYWLAFEGAECYALVVVPDDPQIITDVARLLNARTITRLKRF